MNSEELSVYGIDFDLGLQNCMGKLAFFKKILAMFLNDSCFSRAKNAIQNGSRKEMFSCVHELKGITGNAALMELYSACVPLVNLLRTEGGSDEEIKELFSVIEKAYDNTCLGIRKYLEEPGV